MRAVRADESGLLMSTPSAKNATFTPAPVTRFAACGVDWSSKATCIVCRASGSSSGFAGSVGQIPLCGVVGLPGSADAGFRPLEPDVAGAWIGLTIASGMTAATPGSAASRVCTLVETVAAKPLRTVNWRVTDEPDASMLAISD
jgi:hypothetical protein